MGRGIEIFRTQARDPPIKAILERDRHPLQQSSPNPPNQTSHEE